MNILSKWTAKGRMAAVLMFGAVIAFASGCRELDPPAISVNPTTFEIGPERAQLDLRLMSNTNWEVDQNTLPDWIRPSLMSGRGSFDLVIYVNPYDGAKAEGRQGYITFKTKGSNPEIATVIIYQGESNAKLKIDPPSAEIGNAGGSVKMIVTSNTSWTIQGVIAAPEGWAIPNVESGTEGTKAVTFAVAPNTTGKDREVTFYVYTKEGYDQKMEPFTILQLAVPTPELYLTQTSLFFEAIVVAASKNSISVPVVTEAANQLYASTGVDWCTATIVDVGGVKNVRVTVTDNDKSTDQRKCIVEVTAVIDGLHTSAQIDVTQAGSESPELVILRPVITIPAKDPAVANGSVTFTVGFYTTGTTAVSLIQDLPDWIASAVLTTNTTGGYITVIAKENYGDARTTSLTLVATGGGKTIDRTVIINQLAADAIDFNLTSYIKDVPVGASSIVFYAYSNIPNISVIAVPQQTWITNVQVADATHAGFIGTVKKITADILTNEANADLRTGFIEVIGAYGTQSPIPLKMTINQAGAGAPNAVLARDAITIPAPAGGPYTIGIVGVGSLTPTLVPDVTWITDLDYDNNIISFKATANGQAAERHGIIEVILVSGGVPQFLHIDVTQLGTGSAELDIYQEVWDISAAHHAFDVPIIPIGTTEWEVLSYTPVPMFAVAPVDTDQTKLPLSINQNSSTTPRKATVVLLATNGDSSVFYTVTVNQEGVEAPNLKPIADEVHLGAPATVAGEEFKVPFLGYSSDVTFMSLYFGDPTMFNTTDTKIVPSGNDAYLQISVKENAKLTERNSVIRIVAQRGGENQVFEVKVFQAAAGAPVLIFPTSTFSYGPAAIDDTQIFFENPNGANIYIKSAPAWITDWKPTSGAPGVYDNVMFDVAANATSKTLSGQILIEAAVGTNKAIYTVNVVQSGLAPIGASLAAANLGVQWSEGVADNKIVINNLPDGTLAADIVPNIDVTWLTLGAPVVSGNVATITMTVPAGGANPKTSPRNAYATIVVTRGTESQTLGAVITQEAAPGPEVKLLSDKLVIPASAAASSTYTIPFYNYNSNVTYAPSSDDPSFVTGAVASNVLTVTLVSGPNNDAFSKTATISVIAAAAGVETRLTLEVEQLGVGLPELVIGGSYIFGPAAQTAAGLYYVNDNNAAVTVINKPSWIVENVAATATAYVFDVQANPTASERKGDIVLQAAKGGKTVLYYVPVLQYGLSPLAINVIPAFTVTDSAAGTLEDIFHVTGVPATGVTVAAQSLKTWLATSAVSATNTFQVGKDENATSYPRFGTILVEAKRGEEVVNVTANVLQFAKTFVMPTATVNPSSLLFAADQTPSEGPKTVTISNTDATYVHSVSAPSWVTVSAVSAAAPFTFTVTANGDNASIIPLTGDVVITVKNGDKTQTLIVPVTQKPLLAPIFPVSPSVTFAAGIGGVGAALPIELVGFSNPPYVFTYTQEGSWFTVIPPASPMKIYPNTAWTGTAPRTGKVHVTITSSIDPTYYSQFTINVTQEGTMAPNITYAPQMHTVGINGGQVSTFFQNPDGLTLEIASTTDPNFVSSVVNVSNEFRILVEPNTTTADRTVTIDIVALDGTNAIGSYPITIYQAGDATPAPSYTAYFINAPISVTIAGGNSYTAIGDIDPDYSITGAGIDGGGPMPDWLTSVTPNGNDIDIITDTSDPSFPLAGHIDLVTIEVTVHKTSGGPDRSVYFQIYALGSELGVINASIAPASGTIADTATSIAALAPVVTLDGATVASIDKAYVELGTWLDGATFSVVGGVLTVTGIEANTTTSARSAVITVNLTKTDCVPVSLNFILTQSGKVLAPLGVAWNTSHTVAYDAGAVNAFTPTANLLGAVLSGAFTYDPVNAVPGTRWMTVTTSGGGINVDFEDNDAVGAIPRTGWVEFTMEHPTDPGDYTTQTFRIHFVQFAPDPATGSATVPGVVNCAWNEGSDSFDVTNLPAGVTVSGATLLSMGSSTAFVTAGPTAGVKSGTTQPVNFTLANSNITTQRSVLIRVMLSDGTGPYNVVVNQAAGVDPSDYNSFGDVFSTSGADGAQNAQGNGTTGSRLRPNNDASRTIRVGMNLPAGATIAISPIGGTNVINTINPDYGNGRLTINFRTTGGGNPDDATVTVTITFADGTTQLFTMAVSRDD